MSAHVSETIFPLPAIASIIIMVAKSPGILAAIRLRQASEWQRSAQTHRNGACFHVPRLPPEVIAKHLLAFAAGMFGAWGIGGKLQNTSAPKVSLPPSSESNRCGFASGRVLQLILRSIRGLSIETIEPKTACLSHAKSGKGFTPREQGNFLKETSRLRQCL